VTATFTAITQGPFTAHPRRNRLGHVSAKSDPIDVMPRARRDADGLTPCAGSTFRRNWKRRSVDDSESNHDRDDREQEGCLANFSSIKGGRYSTSVFRRRYDGRRDLAPVNVTTGRSAPHALRSDRSGRHPVVGTITVNELSGSPPQIHRRAPGARSSAIASPSAPASVRLISNVIIRT